MVKIVERNRKPSVVIEKHVRYRSGLLLLLRAFLPSSMITIPNTIAGFLIPTSAVNLCS